MTPLLVTFSDLRGHFAVSNLAVLHNLVKHSVSYLWYVYTWIGKHMWLVISTISSMCH